MTLSPGTIVNSRYRILSVLGQGGMGSVYQAEDTILNVPVAVKENLFLSEEYSRQFEREAKILAALRHPSLPRVGDYFSIIGQGQYLIMDYIQGEDLRERIDRLETISERDVILIGIAICDALNYLHSRSSSILHRDIKPGNIKISPEGDVYLVDFGLAKIMKGNQATTNGARAMTPGYSPPEQYGTARTDPRTDIYSLGATLYAALTGVIPEDGLDRATGKAKLTPLRQLKSNVNRKLAAAIEKSLAVDPDDRYQSANELKQSLINSSDFSQNTWERLRVSPPPVRDLLQPKEKTSEKEPSRIDDLSDIAVSNGNPPPPMKQVKKHKSWVSLILLAAIIGIIAGTFYLRPEMPREIIALISGEPKLTPTFQPTNTQTTKEVIALITETPSLTPTITETPLPTNTAKPTLTASATLTPTITPTLIGGSTGQLVFVSDRTGSNQIWTVNSDSTMKAQLTNMNGGACQPNWSPDGLSIAFISPCAEKENEIYLEANIYIMDGNGENIRILPSSSEKGDFDPAWSPDGKRLAFTSLRNDRPHIFTYNFEDESVEELSDTRFSDIQPSWSPDGTQLAFVRNIVYNHVYIMSEKGFTQFQFSSDGNVNDYWPEWSPDGTFIIYGRSSIDPAIPYLVRLDYEDRNTGNEVRITATGENPISPIYDAALSFDGQWIAFESWPDGRNHDIFILSIDGVQLFRLTNDPGSDFQPDWQPVLSP